jgi:hypothetical protein
MNPKTPLLSFTPSGVVSAVGLALLLVGVPFAPLYAGQVTVNNVNPGSNVTFKYTDPNDPTKTITKMVPGLPLNSKTAVTVQLGLGSLADEDKIKTIFITKTPFGGFPEDPYEVKLAANGMTIASLEPFDIPTFTDVGVPLVAVVDITALLTQGPLFTTGQAISVTNGMTSATSAIVFRDGSTLGPDPDLTDALIGSLPLFNGSAVVYGFDNVAAPEPSYAFLLVALGVLTGLGVVRRRQLSSDRQRRPHLSDMRGLG